MRPQMESDKKPIDDQTPDPCINANGSGILRRNHKGCLSKDFYNWPEQPFEEMDSPFYYQQYIQQLIHRNPADVEEILRLPDGQDVGVWKVEHLRLFCMQLNRLAAKLQDCCHPETCNQMTATEQWIFLCAAHKQPNECPAIDYTRHTLDGAASLLNSNKYFPSRVTVKDNSVAKLGSVCRRIYRIFSHAYYHHFQVFDEFERDTHLCERFSKFVIMYDLMPKESLIVPVDGSKPVEVNQEPHGFDNPLPEGKTASREHLTSQSDTTLLQEESKSEQQQDISPQSDSDTSSSTSASSSMVATDIGVASATVTERKQNNIAYKEDNDSKVTDQPETAGQTVDPKKSAIKSKQPPPSTQDHGDQKKSGWSPGQAHSTNTMVKGGSKIPTTLSGSSTIGSDTSPTSKTATGTISTSSSNDSVAKSESFSYS